MSASWLILGVFFQAEDGIRDLGRSRGLGDVYKRQAEAALAAGAKNAELDPQARDLIGQIACARATLAVTRYQPEAMATQARRALEYLLPENLRFRFTANWALSIAYFFQGDRAAAGRVIAEALAISQTSASMFSTILALSHMGRLQELAGQLHRAAETYRRGGGVGGSAAGRPSSYIILAARRHIEQESAGCRAS